MLQPKKLNILGLYVNTKWLMILKIMLFFLKQYVENTANVGEGRLVVWDRKRFLAFI